MTMGADVIWTTADLPPPPGLEVLPTALFGLTITTLPALPVAVLAAAMVADVDMSPATAAKDDWNWLFSKLATAC